MSETLRERTLMLFSLARSLRAPSLSRALSAQLKSDKTFTPAPASGLSLTFLGTGHDEATEKRKLPALLLQFAGGAMLFDCGEGTLGQLHKSGISPRTLDYIFISHLHGDHLWGLPSLINDIHRSRFSGQLPFVWGPVGLRKYLDTVYLYGFFLFSLLLSFFFFFNIHLSISLSLFFHLLFSFFLILLTFEGVEVENNADHCVMSMRFISLELSRATLCVP